MEKRAAPRIFWLGMHVVLTKTELPRLRELGFEVFNPPYLSDIYDQSANLDWDKNQYTTLPRHVFDTLRNFNFFYNKIPRHIAKLLNDYFDAVIVTINPDWLSAVLNAYDGKIIYRTYGQPYALGPELIRRGLWRDVISRDNFYFVPFCQESLDIEHEWLKQKAFIVPYQLTNDVFFHKDTWRAAKQKNTVTVNIPNIANPYYKQKYEAFNEAYPEDYFCILGVQPPGTSFRRAVGTLARSTQFDFYRTSKAHFYPYTDLVCYLPPIEAMVIGVPVVYCAGSLLHRFFGSFSPGLALNPGQAKHKLDLLLNEDQVFTDEILSSQESVRKRYSPEFVLPIFDAVFTNILSDNPPSQKIYRFDGPFLKAKLESAPVPQAKKAATSVPGKNKTIWILNHFSGTISFTHNKASCFEGIPRVIDQIVSALILTSTYHIVITIAEGSYEAARDFFAAGIDSGRVSLYLVGNRPEQSSPTEEQQIAWCASVAAQYHGSSEVVLHAAEEVGHRMLLAFRINEDESADCVIIPHYYHFPEASFVDRRTIMYVPDYFPHLFPGTKFDGDNDGRNAAIGRSLASRADRVLTMSGFTAGYLSDSDLNIPAEKIRQIPVPWLSHGRVGQIDRETRHTLERLVGGWPYIFYPTANRPNKQIAFLIEVFARLRKRRDDILLVLTTPIPVDSALHKLATDLKVRDAIISVANVTDEMLIWLYEKSASLCLTSTAEGNFPPQIIEALMARTPVVSTRLPTIVELIGENPDSISLCLPMAASDFVEKLEACLSDREAAVARQEPLRKFIVDWSSTENLGRAVISAIDDKTTVLPADHVPHRSK